MSTIYLGIVVFLLLLATFDIVVGVSNDAVNFINSAIGARAAKFRTIIIVSAIGVFAGAALSNGMMDIARHGIFTPQYFTFEEVMCIFLAVMVTDVVLLDIFNTLGMPTSTTVSMVFELLGGAFALAALKVLADDSGRLNLGMLLNTDKALQVIIAIFMSVAVAFVFGWMVQWVARCLFTFTYNKGTRVRQGIFAGVSLTAIVYFLLINGLKGSSLMTPELKEFVDENTLMIVAGCLAGFSFLMTVLSFMRINVLKIVVLSGTFALAMAFAGNDLVNFVGVPLAGLASYQDFAANGAGDVDSFMMTLLQDSARTPPLFLIAAGAVMVIALITSKKARNVVKTSVDLSRQDEGDEMFGSSKVARTLVRNTIAISKVICRYTPAPIARFVNSRFNVQNAELKDGAAFDLLRASVNLVLAGLLVALGTSFRLPLSTTYVTFMVAMGTSLADKAWTRESAVFRVTGVLSVIGGWFITAGVAFFLSLVVCIVMHFGGIVMMLLLIIAAVIILIRSNIRYAKQNLHKDELDEIFSQIAATRGDYQKARTLIGEHSRLSNIRFLDFVRNHFKSMTSAFIGEEYRRLKQSQRLLDDQRKNWKRIRRREIIGMRRIDPLLAIEKNTWFFLANNAVEQMLYCLKRTSDTCIEHLGNNFSPLPTEQYEPYRSICVRLDELFFKTINMLQYNDFSKAELLRQDGQLLQTELSNLRKQRIDMMTAGMSEVIMISELDLSNNKTPQNLLSIKNAELVYINLLQETQELVGSLRHLIRGLSRLQTDSI